MRRARVRKPLKRLTKKRRNHSEDTDEEDFDFCETALGNGKQVKPGE